MLKRILAITLVLIPLGLAGYQLRAGKAETPLITFVPGSRHLADSPLVLNLHPLPSSSTSKLQQVLDESRKEESLPGAVLYISTPNGTWIGASGKASLEAGTLMKPTDRFRIGSVCKTFVSVVVLQLVQEGKLRLDDLMTKFLPKEITKRLPNSNQITIRELLNHTSGLSNYMNDQFYDEVRKDPTHPWTATEVLQFVYNLAPVGTPGEKFDYSDTNYILLELIIDKVTGSTLTTQIRDRILTPLGLNNTFMELREQIPGGFVNSYRKVDGVQTNVTQLNEANGLGDGGLISSASDLAKFVHALLAEGKLLSRQTLKQMLTSFKNDNYGLGLASRQTKWGELLGHSGGTAGHRAEMYYLPTHNITVVVMGNDDDSDKDTYDIVEKALDVVLSSTHYFQGQSSWWYSAF